MSDESKQIAGVQTKQALDVEDAVYRDLVSLSTAAQRETPVTTHRADWCFGNYVGRAFAPIASVVALAASVPSPRYRRFISNGTDTAVVRQVIIWGEDPWLYTTEAVPIEGLRSLVDLLDLPTTEGLAVRFDDPD